MLLVMLLAVTGGGRGGRERGSHGHVGLRGDRRPERLHPGVPAGGERQHLQHGRVRRQCVGRCGRAGGQPARDHRAEQHQAGQARVEAGLISARRGSGGQAAQQRQAVGCDQPPAHPAGQRGRRRTVRIPEPENLGARVVCGLIPDKLI